MKVNSKLGHVRLSGKNYSLCFSGFFFGLSLLDTEKKYDLLQSRALNSSKREHNIWIAES